MKSSGADGPYWTLKGNGGILSTVDDMYRWHLALRNRSALPEAAMKKLEQGYVLEDPKDTTTRYGYGWEFDRAPDGGRAMHHEGSSAHSYAILRRYLDKSLDTERALRKLLFNEPQ